MRSDSYKWVIPNLKDTKTGIDSLRYKVAQAEAQKKSVPTKTIIILVNEFLESMDMFPIRFPEIECENGRVSKEQLAKLLINLSDEKDIVWMKFTKDHYLGVIASSNDINFSMTNTSGEIINFLKKEWDETFVLVFPLIKKPNSCDTFDFNRRLIESGIGNYLISQNVPILDFYSHNI